MRNANAFASNFTQPCSNVTVRSSCEQAARDAKPISYVIGGLMFAFVLTYHASSAAGQQADAEAAVMRRAADIVRPSVVRLDLTGLDARANAQARTVTTGLVVGEEGWIVSSSFGFVNNPEVIFATFDHGERVPARIVARDTSRKLILLKAEPQQRLFVPEFIGLQDVEIGQSVVAVGRVLDREQPNLSLGIVSAKNRIWGKALQSDAKISPNNYGGPLCDWRGRVVGLLVPISPQSDTATAGADWYDSGIGFAIPSEAVLGALPRLSNGQDLHPGILGILPDTTNLLAGPVHVGSCMPRSPADRAGILVGDQIVRVNGRSIQRYADLRHALGPLYAGDACEIEIARDGQKQNLQVTLVDRVPPFAQGYLGVLPMRWPKSEGGIRIRYVFPESPAEALGLKPGDLVTSLNRQAVDSTEQAQRVLAQIEVNDEIVVTVEREGQPTEHSIQLSGVPTVIPDNLAAAYEETTTATSQTIDAVQTLRLPEESVSCLVRLPREFRQDIPHALLVWIDRPGSASEERLEETWGAVCDTMPLIVITPESANPDQWNTTDVDFIIRSMDAAIKEYPIDRNLVAVGGFQSGGSLAMMVALQGREFVRGIAAVDAAVVPQVFEATNEPLRRLSFMFAVSQQDRLGIPTLAARDRLQRAHFPIEFHEFQPKRDDLRSEDRLLIRDWLDRLDQF